MLTEAEAGAEVGAAPHAGRLEGRRSALFPPAAERQRVDALLGRALADSDARVAAGPVTPDFDFDGFARDLDRFTFDRPENLDAVLGWTVAQLERGVVHVNHPRYFGLFNPAPTFPSQCADRIAATFNPQLATAITSPAPVAIEAHVIRAVARRAGQPPGSGGHFTSGGAEANAAALSCALTRAEPAFARRGARAFAGAPRFYISQDSHLAWIKIAHQAGIGRDAARLVATDGQGRMDMRRLADAVAADRAAGCVPVMVVATAGTTNAGMVDPLASCAEIAGRHALWLHVDAAWGGAVVASPRSRHVLAGIETADSLTIDAHKWFATTMGCGMFITRHAALLSEAFQVSTTYMPSNQPAADPYVTSAQWSRRFLGLRLFLSLAAAGWDGYADHVEHAIETVALLRDALAARGWRIANDSALAVLCVEPPPGAPDVATIVRRVLRSGEAWVSVARFDGRDVVRACVTHGQTAAGDVTRLVDSLSAAL